MKVLALFNIKGGVGKTSSAVNLAYLAAKEGGRTLVWDLDPQGAASFCFRIRPRIKGSAKRLVRGKLDLDGLIRGTDFEGLDLLPADFSYRKFDLALGRNADPGQRLHELLHPLRAQYDYVVLDCPPSISLLSDSVFVASDALLVPTIPTTLSVRALDMLDGYLERFDDDRPALFPFLCMVDSRKSMHREITHSVLEHRPECLRTPVPYASAVEQMTARRAPLFSFAFGSPAARAYEELWREFRPKLMGVDE